MESHDDFVRQFEKLMQIPQGHSLRQWQYLYKEVVFTMGMRILKEFPQDVFGPDPFNGSTGGAGGGGHSNTGTTSPGKGKHPEKDGGPGPGLGGHPYVIITGILNGVLQLEPTPPKKKE